MSASRSWHRCRSSSCFVHTPDTGVSPRADLGPPAPVLGRHRLLSTPSGAEVWQEGRQLGVTPFERPVEARAGAETHYEVRLAGHRPASVRLPCDGQPHEQSVPLARQEVPASPPPGKAGKPGKPGKPTPLPPKVRHVIDSVPRGALVYSRDGHLLGPTPVSREHRPTKGQQATYRVVLAGFPQQTVTFPLEGTPHPKTVTFARPAPLPSPAPSPARAPSPVLQHRISSTPPGATVYSEQGQPLGQTPCTVTRPVVPGGKGMLLLRLPLHEDRRVPLALDSPQTIAVTLVPKIVVQ
ncbi:MAG: PEGA domain-containing protein [Myxococcota bacterium]|nr:PEGA domain-containing protein [Myxococcota bacterium]